jgi:GNAT superfamily N-acetyltransferase
VTHAAEPLGDEAIVFRPGEESDKQETLDVMRRASSTLHQSHGLPPSDGPAPARAIAFRAHALRYDQDRFWVAQAGDRIAGFGIATLREGGWYLAALHVLPEYQSAGAGRELLRRCLATAPASGLRLTLSEAMTPVSNALYARHGMVPRAALLTFEGPATAASAGLVASLAAGPGPTASTAVDEIDREVLGWARRIDHEFWGGLPGVSAFLLTAGHKTVGYAYVSADGSVGPAAFSAGVDPEAAVRALIQCGADLGAAQVRLRVFGSARPVIEYLLGAGFRLQPDIGLLLATEPFGQLERYLASSDALV